MNFLGRVLAVRSWSKAHAGLVVALGFLVVAVGQALAGNMPAARDALLTSGVLTGVVSAATVGAKVPIPAEVHSRLRLVESDIAATAERAESNTDLIHDTAEIVRQLGSKHLGILNNVPSLINATKNTPCSNRPSFEIKTRPDRLHIDPRSPLASPEDDKFPFE